MLITSWRDSWRICEFKYCNLWSHHVQPSTRLHITLHFDKSNICNLIMVHWRLVKTFIIWISLKLQEIYLERRRKYLFFFSPLETPSSKEIIHFSLFTCAPQTTLLMSLSFYVPENNFRGFQRGMEVKLIVHSLIPSKSCSNKFSPE